MDFKKPIVVYVAPSNVEAHLITLMLSNNGVESLAVDDVSGASLWTFGRLSQFHRPKIWVDASMEEDAKRLLLEYEKAKRNQAVPKEEGNSIEAECEQCGKTSIYPSSLDSTTQECQQCGDYLDVGECDWEDDFGEPE